MDYETLMDSLRYVPDHYNGWDLDNEYPHIIEETETQYEETGTFWDDLCDPALPYSDDL